MPERIQRKRTKGWRMPDNAVYVGRPTIYGNPFEAMQLSCGCWEVQDDNDVAYMHHYPIHEDGHPPITRTEAVENAVRLYAQEITYWLGGRIDWDPEFSAAVKKLAGKDLACWCPLDSPCHADVLLELANG